MNAVDAVQAVELACHRAVNFPSDDIARMMLLEALASFKAMPLALFPPKVVDLIGRSHDQADALTDRILASNSLADPSIDHEIRAVCDTLSSLAVAMRLPSAVNDDERGE